MNADSNSAVYFQEALKVQRTALSMSERTEGGTGVGIVGDVSEVTRQKGGGRQRRCFVSQETLNAAKRAGVHLCYAVQTVAEGR